jgi:hypothetical protein
MRATAAGSGAPKERELIFDHEHAQEQGEPIARCCHGLGTMQCLRAPADVAQLVEQRFRKPQVTGSNPVVGSSLRSQQSGVQRLSRRSLGGGGLFCPQINFVAS